jgi:protein-tyrosine phosphatase
MTRFLVHLKSIFNQLNWITWGFEWRVYCEYLINFFYASIITTLTEILTKMSGGSMGKISKVYKNIYLSGMVPLQSNKIYQTLHPLNVKTIISMTLGKPISVAQYVEEEAKLGNQILHFHFPLDDITTANISQYFKRTNKILDLCLAEGSNVLVHCMAGISRSSTIICAWILHRTTSDTRPNSVANVERVVSKLRTMRPIVNPNRGFRESLILFDQSIVKAVKHKKQVRFNLQAKAKKAAAKSKTVAPKADPRAAVDAVKIENP